MTRLDYYWQSNPEWCYFTENGDFIVRDDAPEEAKESYRHYLQQLKEKTKKELFKSILQICKVLFYCLFFWGRH